MEPKLELESKTKSELQFSQSSKQSGSRVEAEFEFWG